MRPILIVFSQLYLKIEGMPSRRVQTLFTAIFLLVLFFCDKSDIASLWMLIPAGIAAVASFIMGDLVNQWWFEKFPSRLTNYELRWVDQFVSWYRSLGPDSQSRFSSALAYELIRKEFITMGEKGIPEEWKLMALAPAISLGLLSTKKESEHYSRIVFYQHPFPSPNQNYLHISENEEEDGVLIFSIPQLEAAYVNPTSFFNTALYEWGIVFFRLYPHQGLENEQEMDSLRNVFLAELGIQEEDLKKFLMQPSIHVEGLIAYAYLMNPDSLMKFRPDLFEHINNLVDF